MSGAAAPGGFDEESFEHLPDAEGRSLVPLPQSADPGHSARYFPERAQHARGGLRHRVSSSPECARRFPEMRLVGGELFSAGLDVAAQAGAGRRAAGRWMRASSRSRSEFDVVGAFDVLEHIEEDERVLAEIHAALRPGGGLLLTVPQHPRLWSPVDEYSHHVRRYRRRDLLEKMRGARFRDRSLDVVRVAAPAGDGTVADCVNAGRRPSIRSPSTAHRPSVDSALGWVLGGERALIRAGVPLPAGGSLFVAARRG